MDAIAKPKGCTSFKLRQLSRVVARHYDAHVAASGLKTSQYSLLSNVLATGPVRPVDLAARMSLDASTLTRNLKPLIAEGWVEVGEGADARSRLVHITPAGRAKRDEARALWQQAQRSLNERLGLVRVAQLHALIDEALDLLAPGEVDDPAC
ncbi:MAG: winged helix-turn-helix transcriptional regulator [Proteobacteria bacterium]|nr:winged helix-turn-helix transcriptional regulator [Pseudomonadota bacterium]